MEQIYTIPVNEAFEASAADKTCGCPICALYRKLEADELSIILGASMMEPDIRIQTNKKGFCSKHYSKMLKMSNRLGMALILESHLDEVRASLENRSALPFLQSKDKPLQAMAELEKSCYICERIENNMQHMIETAVILWDRDPDFKIKLKNQPYFCLPHYRRLLEYAKSRLSKKAFADFSLELSSVQSAYSEELSGDVSWFCKKFDYRYENEPWGNSKDAIERAIKFLNGDF